MISDSLKIWIQGWIINHPSLVASSIAKYTVLVRYYITSKKTNIVGKYLIKISFREFHNDLIKSKNEGGLNEVWKCNKVLVSGTGLCYIILINVQIFTPRYKQMYIC